MLKQRLITGIILTLIALTIVFFAPFYIFITATSLAILLAAWEWAKLSGLSSLWMRIGYLAVIGLVLTFSRYIPLRDILGIGVVFWIVSFVSLLSFAGTGVWFFNKTYTKAALGIVALVPCWVVLNGLKLTQDGSIVLFFLLCLVWATDTGAYFVGSWIGGVKLMPSVSPKKTWAGFFGGVLLAMIVAGIFCAALKFPPRGWASVMILSVGVSLFSVIGDLQESLLKRLAHVKDSGNYLPGHGGILDRIDGLLAASPIFLMAMLWFAR